MDPEISSSWNVLFVFLIVAVNGLFVAAEFAMVRSHLSKLKSPEFKGLLGLNPALKLLENLDFSLSATQLGITISSLVLGWWGEHAFQEFFFGILVGIDAPTALVSSHIIATVLALALVTFLHVVLGELVAKSVAIRYPETTLRYLAGPMLIFTLICKPLIRFLTACSTFILSIFGMKTAPETERTHSMSELSMIVTHSGEKGVLDKTEEEMLQGVFGFSETVAREIMTPRTDLVTVHDTSTLEQLVQTAVSSGFSRLPVIGESIDDIQGVIMVRDLLPYVHNLRHSSDREFNIRRLLREPYFVPGTKSISDLLNEFKRRKIHIAIILDEHGGVDGVVTLEDVIEEIVGDIFDESDVPEKDIVVQENGDVIVDGGVLVADINNQLDFEIPEGDYDTIAGFIYTSLGRLPRAGDEIVIRESGEPEINQADSETTDLEAGAEGGFPSETTPPSLQITVERVTGRRIERVKLQRLHQVSEPTSEQDASEQKVSEASGK